MASCWYPYQVERKVPTSQTDTHVPVPCGRCPECLQRRASMWGFRLKKQEEISKSAHFVTFTYDNENLPKSKNNFRTLDKTHFQGFMKRLRKNTFHKNKISYYACGEYGGKFGRPHYHAIIFNTDEETIRKSWTAGYVHIDVVNGATIAYTVKYINKGHWSPAHKNDDRNPEFALMSKRMGSNYLTPEVVDHHRQDLRKAYVTLEDGIKMALPRYYKDKLFPITASAKTITQHPSILLHFEENEKMRKEQGRIIEKLQAEKAPTKMSDREIHEARKNAINTLKIKHNKRKDL